MKLPFGFEITRKASPGYGPASTGWWPVIREPFTGAWQRNKSIRSETLLTYHAVYSCITLIASDVAKCRPKLVQQDSSGIWTETEAASFSPVLRKPNDYQNRIQFFESWMLSKLIFGNTYVLKERDNRGVVVALYVLDPQRVKPLVAPDGSVFYQLTPDNLSGVTDDRTIVPASEIIHDLATLRYHPLCGIPPMAPAALAATHGLNIQNHSINLFENDSRPGGLLLAPGKIDEATVNRLREMWEQKYSGGNIGRLAVLGDDLKYQPMVETAVNTQLIEQLGISGKMVCSSFNVPAHMVGVGDPPSYNNIEAINQQYYSQCLQKHFESIELLLDEGLGLTQVQGKIYGTEFDLDTLLRMDTATRIKTYSDAVRGGLFKPNEARSRFDLTPVTGGDEVYLQQQNFSLAALAKRDAKDDPFASGQPQASPPRDNQNAENDTVTALLAGWELKSLLLPSDTKH